MAVHAGDDSHDDFKPKYKSEPVSDAKSQIEKDIADNKVFIYMKVSLAGPWLLPFVD
jgi:hypothetical protein